MHCRNLFLSRWALICPVKPLLSGSSISNMAVGDQVFGVTNTQFLGAYAEYAVASAAMLAKKPSSLSYVEAASVPVVAVTAWQGLFDQARLEAGQTVVIHGAQGTSEPTRFSSRVALACARSRRREPKTSITCGTLGADKVVDYHTQRFEDEVKDADAVLDLVGGETQMRSFQVLRLDGKLISTVSQPDQDRAKHHGVNAAFFLVEVSTERLRRIAELIDRGELKTRGAVLPLADAREAHMMLEGRRALPRGKIILNVEATGEVTPAAG